MTHLRQQALVYYKEHLSLRKRTMKLEMKKESKSAVVWANWTEDMNHVVLHNATFVTCRDVHGR